MKSLTYLLVDLGSFLVPFIFSFHPKLKFYKEWKHLGKALLVCLLIFLPWDMYFTQKGIWGFNPDYLCGIYIYNLPLEEVLFFICIPYASLYTYHCFEVFGWRKKWRQPIEWPVLITGILFVLFALWNYQKWYTFSAFITSGTWLILSRKKTWLPFFLISFIILLIPFFIVNGILTGTGLDNPIVWYNDEHNLGIRMLTIPLEDTFYGLFMLGLGASVMEYSKSFRL
jgi:lycopene cyclase domain-containing protein